MVGPIGPPVSVLVLRKMESAGGLSMVGLIDALVLGVVFGMVESAGVQPDAPAAQRVFPSQLYKNRLRHRYVKPRCRRKTWKLIMCISELANHRADSFRTRTILCNDGVLTRTGPICCAYEHLLLSRSFKNKMAYDHWKGNISRRQKFCQG